MIGFMMGTALDVSVDVGDIANNIENQDRTSVGSGVGRSGYDISIS